MAYDIFLKIDGIDGESMDDKHKNEIGSTELALEYSSGIHHARR